MFFSYEHKIAQECLTCSDAPLHYVEFKYTHYSEAFIENVKSPGSWTAKFGGRAGKRNQETKWIRVNTGTVKRTGDTAVLHQSIEMIMSIHLPLLCLISLVFDRQFVRADIKLSKETSNLCKATPLCGESTGDWLIPLRQRLKSSIRWFETPWRSCDVTVLWGPACACIHIDTQILR